MCSLGLALGKSKCQEGSWQSTCVPVHEFANLLFLDSTVHQEVSRKLKQGYANVDYSSFGLGWHGRNPPQEQGPARYKLNP